MFLGISELHEDRMRILSSLAKMPSCTSEREIRRLAAMCAVVMDCMARISHAEANANPGSRLPRTLNLDMSRPSGRSNAMPEDDIMPWHPAVSDLDKAGAGWLGDELEEGDMEGDEAQAQLAGLEALSHQLCIGHGVCTLCLVQLIL